jgi:hypothetical protein
MIRPVILSLLCFIVSAAASLADDIPAAKIVSMVKGKVTFEADGKEQTLSIGLGLKFFDKEGKELPLDQGIGMLQAGNVVKLTTSKDDTSPQPRIRSVTLVSGTIPTANAAPMVDLKPDPNFKEKVGSTSPPNEWLDYFPTAKVGDFAEYKGFGRVRHEVIAADGETITVARVVDTRGTRNEFCTKYTLNNGQKRTLEQKAKAKEEAAKPVKPAPKKKLTPEQERAQKIREKNQQERAEADAKRKAEKESMETVTIDGREITCLRVKHSFQSETWTSPEVPFDGLVKRVAPNDNLTLVSFGRGK